MNKKIENDILKYSNNHESDIKEKYTPVVKFCIEDMERYEGVEIYKYNFSNQGLSPNIMNNILTSFGYDKVEEYKSKNTLFFSFNYKKENYKPITVIGDGLRFQLYLMENRG